MRPLSEPSASQTRGFIMEPPRNRNGVLDGPCEVDSGWVIAAELTLPLYKWPTTLNEATALVATEMTTSGTYCLLCPAGRFLPCVVPPSPTLLIANVLKENGYRAPGMPQAVLDRLEGAYRLEPK